MGKMNMDEGELKSPAMSKKKIELPKSVQQEDQIVYDIFDEFQKEISAMKKLHPSEEVNKTHENSKSEIYNFINSYHVQCQLCNQHFYSQSILNDINSFFQKHINTDYHKSCKLTYPNLNGKPILEWEKWLYTGHCNICNISGIPAYLINSTVNVTKAVTFHNCYLEFAKTENSQRFNCKIELLRKYCTLSFFRDKFIRVLDDSSVVCLLCSLKLVGAKETACCHLGSNTHFNNFCKLIWKYFQFVVKDLLNGFNLEMVTRWLIKFSVSSSSDVIEVSNEKKICWDESNSSLNVYGSTESNFGFSPKQIEDLLMLHFTDLVSEDKCLLCDEKADVEHLISHLQLQKAPNLSADAFNDKEKYQIYLANRDKRLQPHLTQIIMYNKLKEDLEIYGLKIGMPYKPKYVNVLVDKNKNKKKVFDLNKKLILSTRNEAADSVVSLIKEEYNLVENIYSPLEPGYSMCHVCDKKVPTHEKNVHSSKKKHVQLIQVWNLIKFNFENPKFFEPIMNIKKCFVCLLCGINCSRNSIVSHIKDPAHHGKFEDYISSNPSMPINLSFQFEADDSCTCLNCGAKMNAEKPTPLSLTLDNIKNHWPCTAKKKPNREGFEKTLVSELESIYNANKNVVMKNQKIEPAMSVPCPACGKPIPQNEMKDHDCKMVFDFGGLQKTLKGFMNVFENKIIENVASNLNLETLNLSTGSQQPEIVKILKREDPPEEAAVSEIQIDNSSDVKSTEKTVEEKCIKTEVSKSEKTANEVNGEDLGDVEDEVLIVKDVKKIERDLQTFFFFFNRFGKVMYVFFEKSSVIIAFRDKGLAKKVADDGPIFIRNLKFDVMWTMRKRRSKTTEKLISLNKDIVRLFEEPHELMNFALNLMNRSLAMSISYVEKMREELVCKTIISAVAPVYPNSICFPFGSRLSGLFLNRSDFDVFLDCGGMYDGFKNTKPSLEQSIVREVGRALRKRRECVDLIVVERARVPIVSFFHKPAKLHCDLSFKNGLSVQNTLMLKFVVSLDWRVRPLILFLKHWADLNSIHGPPYFSSYAIALMVIFYLQQLPSPILPTIETLQKNFVGPRITIRGWDCNFSTNSKLLPKVENKDSLLDLFLGFFEYYASFDYGKYVITPLLGEPLPREAFSESSNVKLPMSIKRHIVNIPFPLEKLVPDKIQICIMDPFDLSHILTKSFCKQSLQLYVHLCEKSAALLKEGMKKSR